MKYKQCLLRKGDTSYMAWIPEKFAKKGKYVRLRGDNGWEVVFASNLCLEEQEIADRSQDYRRHRRATDI